MTDDDKQNQLAVAMTPLLRFLHDYLGLLLDSHAAQIVLVVELDGELHVSSKSSRTDANKVMADALARRQPAPGTRPPDTAGLTADIRRFTHLLNTLEVASQAPIPARAGYAEARRALQDYVSDLQERANQGKGAR